MPRARDSFVVYSFLANNTLYWQRVDVAVSQWTAIDSIRTTREVIVNDNIGRNQSKSSKQGWLRLTCFKKAFIITWHRCGVILCGKIRDWPRCPLIMRLNHEFHIRLATLWLLLNTRHIIYKINRPNIYKYCVSIRFYLLYSYSASSEELRAVIGRWRYLPPFLLA